VVQDFIVLGIIPGTDFQTTFNFWLAVGLSFVALLYVPRYAVLRRHIRTYLTARQIARTIDRFDLITI